MFSKFRCLATMVDLVHGSRRLANTRKQNILSPFQCSLQSAQFPPRASQFAFVCMSFFTYNLLGPPLQAFTTSARRNDLAKLVLIGNLGKAPELKTTKNDKQYVSYVFSSCACALSGWLSLVGMRLRLSHRRLQAQTEARICLSRV